MRMEKKTVLVASRHPHLEDVRRRVLEQAGYQVVTTRNPEQVEQACKLHKIDLVVIGYSVTQAEKNRIAAEATTFCKCPILELWDRHPPQRREEYPVFDHFSLAPEDFLDTVNSLLERTSRH
jgi:DNA-binding response OmpR family regulator